MVAKFAQIMKHWSFGEHSWTREQGKRIEGEQEEGRERKSERMRKRR